MPSLTKNLPPWWEESNPVCSSAVEDPTDPSCLVIRSLYPRTNRRKDVKKPPWMPTEPHANSVFSKKHSNKPPRTSSSVWIAILTAVTRTAPYEDGRFHGHNNNNNKNRRVGRRRRRNGSCFFHVGNDTHTQVQTGGGPQQTTPPARRTKDLLVVLRLL